MVVFDIPKRIWDLKTNVKQFVATKIGCQKDYS